MGNGGTCSPPGSCEWKSWVLRRLRNGVVADIKMIPGGNSGRPSSGIVLAGLIWLSISQLLVRQGYVWQKSTELRCVNELSKRLRGEMVEPKHNLSVPIPLLG